MTRQVWEAGRLCMEYCFSDLLDQAANHPIMEASKVITRNPRCRCDAIPIRIDIRRA